MSMIGEDSSGQLISWRQQSLEKFVSQGGLIAAAPSTTTAAIRPLRFCKDPYTISHPIYATCGRIRCSKPALSISKAVLQISHQRTAHVATVSCPLHYRGRESNQGINIIAMDDRGEYLAVCSRSGFIRVYGGQALIEASYNRERLEALQPIGIIDTRKNIAQIHWREGMDGQRELLVCFSFSSTVQLYDLSTLSSSIPVKRSLETNGIGKDGGHLSALLWTKEKSMTTTSNSYLLNKKQKSLAAANGPPLTTSSSTPSTTHFFIAGNEKGILHCWNLTSSSNKCFWNVKMDPSRSLELSRPVVGLHIARENHLVAFSDDGLLSLWDLLKSKPAAFGVNGNEPALLSFHHVGIPSNDLLHQIRVHAGNVDHAMLLLTQQVWIINMYKKTTLQRIQIFDASSVLLRSELIPTNDLIEELNGDTFDSNRNTRMTRNNIITPQFVLPTHFPSMIYATYNNQYLASVDIEASSSFNVEWDVHSASLIRRNIHTGEIESCCRKGKQPHSLQLPGFIMFAENGDYELQLSHDVQHYLGNNVLTYSSMSRSNEVWITWHDGTEQHLIACTIESTRQHHVKLMQPYPGPNVENGYPKVYLKTNLIAGSWGESSSRWTTTHQCLPTKHVLAQLDFGSPCVMSTYTHPHQILSIVGFDDDSIGVIGLRSKDLIDDDFPTINPDIKLVVEEVPNVSEPSSLVVHCQEIRSIESEMIIFKDEIANEEKVIPKSAKPGDCDIYAFDADSDVEETASNEIEEREVMKEETVVETKTSFLSKELKFASKKRNNSILEDSVLNPRRKLCADNEISTTLPVGKENQSVVLKKVADLFSTKTLNKNNVVETKQIQKTGGKLSLNNKASKLSTNSGKVSKITSFFSQNK